MIEPLLDHVALYFLIHRGVPASIARKWIAGQWDTGEGEYGVQKARDDAAVAIAAVASFNGEGSDG